MVEALDDTAADIAAAAALQALEHYEGGQGQNYYWRQDLGVAVVGTFAAAWMGREVQEGEEEVPGIHMAQIVEAVADTADPVHCFVVRCACYACHVAGYVVGHHWEAGMTVLEVVEGAAVVGGRT